MKTLIGIIILFILIAITGGGISAVSISAKALHSLLLSPRPSLPCLPEGTSATTLLSVNVVIADIVSNRQMGTRTRLVMMTLDRVEVELV